MRKTACFLLPFIALSLLLIGCSSGPVKTQTQADDLFSYKSVYIDRIDVSSKKQGPEYETKNTEVAEIARSELQSVIEGSRYRLLATKPGALGAETDGKDQPTSALDAPLERTLAASLDIDVVYGSRALRYVVGFGAGKGSIHSILTVRDAATAEVKFRAEKESMIAMGMFGGDMSAVIRENIEGLVAEYPGARKLD